MSLQARFAELWSRAVGSSDAESAWRRLDAGYADDARAYHGWPHIEAMLRDLDAARPEDEFRDVRFDEVELAIFFHDAIYDARRNDNEAASAALLADEAAPRDVGRASALILATARHDPSMDAATRLLVDADLAILGANADVYGRYAAAIRTEYDHVPDDAWRFGRSAVLKRFLSRGRVFQSAYFGHRLEAAARENVATELDLLAHGRAERPA